MSSLFLTHTPAEGTLLAGTSRGDGSAAVLKRLGWRWSRQMECWYIPDSRDRHPQQNLINTTIARVEELGMAVDVDVTPGLRSAKEVEQDREARSAARLERLQAGAARSRIEAGHASRMATEVAGRMSTPQPVLVGHHSESATRRHYDSVTRSSRVAVEAEAKAASAESGMRAAEAALQRRDDPAYVGRQVLKLEADILGVSRLLGGSSRKLSNGTIETTPPAAGQIRTDLETQLGSLEDFLRYWKSRQETLREAAGIPALSRETVMAGDTVKYDGVWFKVLRANERTVTVSLGSSGSVRYSYGCIQDHRRAPAGS